MRTTTGAVALRLAPVLWSTVLAVLMLGSALAPGFVLTYDMVWVPDLAVRGDFLGLGSSLPRAVPSDMVVALADEVVPGMVLQKAVLVGTLVVAGTGAWRLVGVSAPVGRSRVLAGLAASTLYVWNPFVVERLAIGHWPLLMTYAALPYIHLHARRLAAGERSLPQLALWLAFASLSPAGGIVAGVYAVVGVATQGRTAARSVAWTVGAVAAVNAPWIAAGALHGAGAVSDAAAVRLFAAQGEGVLPAWAAVLGLGGIWNSEVVPASRTGWVALVSLVLVLAVCAAGLRSWLGSTSGPARWALVAPAVLGLVVGLAGAAAPEAVGWVVSQVPGGGLVRDGTRFVALVAPLQAVLFGHGVARLSASVPARAPAAVLGTVLVLAPLTLMPDAALGLSGRLGAVDFPDEHEAARRAVEQSRHAGREGDVLSLPFTSYRRPGWNDYRRTLDPVGRYLPADYLASDTLVVSGTEVPGEDPRARRVARDLATMTGGDLEQALASEGIAWVVADLETTDALRAEGFDAPGLGSVPDLPSAQVLHRGELLTVWELPVPEGSASRAPTDRSVTLAVLLAAWTLAGGVVAAALVVAGHRGWTSLRRMRREA